ncbi:hypothetical protein PAXRUDRAFT_825705 [Paxillus rubicundulus Ve08.2h10]|uniref:SLC41A/MgtE integral membrane domain-containing protein n=1 Tax=Paxillus rubicundulus Ve08.2h10 TaxID=930991 RepID=A0A0D0DFX1_9AGAM|nr:hypothetical protein PAXRUDRAFT_825705 [Paxillus rubicundulus Ve08.2h10]
MNGPAKGKRSSLSDDPFVVVDALELGDLRAVCDSPPSANVRVEQYEDQDNSTDDLDGGDGDAALLGAEGRTRGMERLKRASAPGWRQVSSIVIESAPTLLFTTVGLLFTGELLDHVSRWRAMMTIDELIMIIPVVLNLKGNLEMNLSARLGTAANMGELDDPKARRKIISGSLALLQVQATVVACVAACVAMVLGLLVPDPSPAAPIPLDSVGINSTILMQHGVRATHLPLPVKTGNPKSGLIEFIMVASSAMLSACTSSIILGSFMCALIVICRRYGRDPDNIAPPVASCLGDLVTLCLLGTISSILINFANTLWPLIIVLLLICSAASCAFVVRGNSVVKHLIWQGWTPLFGAMVISSATGIVLDTFASRYQGFPLLAIVISGLPGSVGSIFVSRLSTSLHASISDISRSRTNEPSPRMVMITLFLVTLPVEIIFLATLHAFGWLKLPIIFAIFSVIFFCCAVSISLVVARTLTNYLWSKALDPDTYALPIHSAMMDLIGQLLLVLCFTLVSLIGIKL